MRTKILKNGKSALSFVVAIAVIAVSLFIVAPVANLTASAAALTATDTWDGTMVKPTETDSEGNIIINNAEELAWVALSDETQSGENYKVKAGQVFDLNGMQGITSTSTAAQVAAATKTGKLWANATDNNKNGFAGNFDGNGLIVFNANSASAGSSGQGGAGLFPWLKMGAASRQVKNVKILASYFRGYHYAGGLIGEVYFTNTSTTLAIENCEVANSVIETHTHTQRAGGLVGGGQHAQAVVSNCYIHDNTITGSKCVGGIFASLSGFGKLSAVGVVVLGASPVATATSGNEGGLGNMTAATYSSVYTDASVSGVAGVIPNDKSAMTGTACANLDFTTVWLANAGVPELRVFHTLAATNNGDTHAETCTKCGLSGLAAEHNYSIVDYDNGTSACACGAKQAGIVDTWDGTTSEPTTTDEAGNIVIKTAEELAWVALEGGNNTAGKNYTVVPKAKFDMGGMAGITINSTAAEVAATSSGIKQWKTINSAVFQGNFDGNGLVVYNIFAASADNDGRSALFPKAKAAEMTIKNVAVLASRFTGYHAAAGIVGNFSNTQNEKINFINCEVGNCYISDNGSTGGNRGAAGLVADLGNSTPQLVENCYVHDNTISATGGAGAFIGRSGLYVAGGSTVEIKNSIAMGTSPYSTGDSVGNFITMAVFTNVYTDDATAVDGVTQVTAWAGQELKEGLSPTVWFANTTKEPVLRIFHNIKGTSNGAAGHTSACADCGLTAIAAEAHDWSANDGVCSVCDYECDHANATEGDVVVAGDCTTDREVKQVCECGAAPNKIIPATGHVLSQTSAGSTGNCGNDGEHAYWTCSVCDGLTLSDDAFAATVDYDTDIRIPATGNHTPLEDASGIVYDMNLEGHHRYICSVCNVPYNAEAHSGEMVTNAANPASGHEGSCTVCGFGTNGTEPHNFGDDNVCDGCNWVCEDHVWDDGQLSQVKDCITDEITDYTCTICGTVDHKVTSEATGHSFDHKTIVEAKCNEDGVMAHEYCTVCNKKYADGANDKTPFENAVSDGDLVITERPACTTTPVAEDPATCTEPGVKAHDLCETCGKIYVGGVLKDEAALKIDETGHKYDAFDSADNAIWYTDDDAHWHICTICGVVDKKEHAINTDKTSYEGTYVTCDDGCGYEYFIHEKASADGVVSIVADRDAFSKDVWTTIKDIISEDAEYSAIKALLKDSGIEDFIIYDITPDEEMADGASATVTYNVPELFSDNVAIYYVDITEQTTEKLDTTVVKDEKTGAKVASAETDHFSVYVLADLGAVKEDLGGSDNNDNLGGDDYSGSTNGDSSSTSPATAGQSIAIAIAVAALLAGAAFVVVRKVRKA